MAYITEVTVGMASTVNHRSSAQKVSVSLTYQLERTDTDLVAFLETAARELGAAHAALWKEADDPQTDVDARSALPSRPPSFTAGARTSTAPSVSGPPNHGHLSGAFGAGNGTKTASPPAPGGTAQTPITNTQKLAIRGHCTRIGLSDRELADRLRAQFGTPDLDRLCRDEAHSLLQALRQGASDRPAAHAGPTARERQVVPETQP